MIHWLLLLWLRLSSALPFPHSHFPIDIVVGLPSSEGSKAKNPFLLTLGKSQPVFDVAVEDIYHKHHLLPEKGLRISYEDTALSDSLGPQRIIQRYCDRTVDAVMGIAYVYGLAPIARMSTYWYSGVPVFTTTALVDELGDRKAFPLLTRMMGSYKSLAYLTREITKTFGWNHFYFLFNDEAVHGGGVGRSECYFSLSTIKNLIQKQKDVVWSVKMFSEFTTKRKEYKKMLFDASMDSNRGLCFSVFGLPSFYPLGVHCSSFCFLPSLLFPTRDLTSPNWIEALAPVSFFSG